MNFYPHNIGDYRAATAHLGFEEDAAYRRLLDIYYLTEKPLPLDRKRIHTLTLCQTARHRHAVDSVLDEFFTKTGDGYRHERCDREIARAAEKRGKARESAEKRWQAAASCEGNANAYAKASQNGMRTHSEGNATPHDGGNAPNPNPNKEDDDDSAGARAGAGAGEGPTFELVELALADITELGSHPVRVNPVIAPIWQLVQSGFDLKTQIVPSIRRQVDKAKHPVQRWSYFVQGIIEDAQKIAVKPLGAKPNGSHRPTSIAGGFDLIERAIAAEERAIAEAEGRHGGSEVHPVAIPGLRQGTT